MLYGNIIFIKKTGGDGSKYPVSEKSLKIGRSEECLIRIYNPQVALEHCQLIIGENGQATLKDLSNQTFLNGKTLAHEECTLCHGDTFKVGERLARWEYLPTSKYYRQLPSSTGRLVAVVMPQQRCLEDQSSGTSASFSVLKNIPVGGKRRYSERFTSESASGVKTKDSRSSSLIKKSKGDLSKLLIGRHSLKTRKLLLPVTKTKDRKSTSGIINSKTPKGKFRKSTLPSWKVNIVSSPTTKPTVEETIKSCGKLNLVLTRIDKSKGFSLEELQNLGRARGVISDKNLQSMLNATQNNKGFPDKIEQSTVKIKTSEKFDKTSNKCFPDKTLNSSESKVKTAEVNETEIVWEGLAREKLKTSAPIDFVQTCPLSRSEDVTDSKKGRQALNFQSKSISAKSTPLKKTSKKLEKTIGKPNPSSSRKSLSKSSSRSGTSAINSDSAVSPKSSSVRISLRKTNLSKERISSPRGVRRKLSPSTDSAERAAKKLKTNIPKKPDKNKKAALLVLGKANRKQLLAQNVKVLLKQKIVKRAIKQSAATGTEKVDHGKKKSFTAVKSKPKRGSQKNTLKTKKKAKKKNDSSKGNTPKNSPRSAEVPSQGKDEMGCTAKEENAFEGNVISESKVPETSLRSPSKFKNSFNETPGKSLSKQYRKSESSRSILSKESGSPYGNFETAAENFLFNSSRRCSKRLSSKNDLGRPDFVELSPTALGLIPKNIEIFKSPKQNKRRSSSLVTPKNAQSFGIIKSASTSKIGNRKNVRFSSKGMSFNSEFSSPSEKTDFDFGAFETPDVSVDAFISPLGDKTSGSKKGLNESSRIAFASEDNSEVGLGNRNSVEPRKCIRKLLQSPQTKNRVSSNQNELLRGSGSSAIKGRKKPADPVIMNSENNLSDFDLEICTTPKSNLSDINGVLRLLRSPKNDSTDVKGLKKLSTRKLQRSPKNDLSDVRGVKKLLTTPKAQKSPKNDLSDVRGVKKLLGTPKVQKSPKNDLSDVRGVKKLLGTPKVQKSPKNDLSDVRGVKKLLTTPKAQKSPKNDLSDVRGVKKLLTTPKAQKSPKNDLSDVRGVKKLLGTPKVQKSPKNDLSDVRGVKKLLGTSKVQKSPKNNLTDVAGVKELFRSPRVQRSPKNELLDLSGVQQLFGFPKLHRSSKGNSVEAKKENLFEFFGENSLKSPRNENLSKDSTEGVKGLCESGQLDRDAVGDTMSVDGIKQLLEVEKSRGSVPKNQKSASRKSRVSNFRAIVGERLMYSTSKEPRNDLSDLTGVRELFIGEKPNSGFNESLTGVPELFNLPEEEAASGPKGKTPRKRSTTYAVQKEAEDKDEYIKTRRGTRSTLRQEASVENITRRSTRSKKSKTDDGLTTELTERKPTKRQAARRTKPSEVLKSPAAVKRSERIQKETEKSGRTSQVRAKAEAKQSGEIKARKRKAAVEDAVSSPPKLRRRSIAESIRTTKSATAPTSREEIPAKAVRKASAKVKGKTSKSSSKVQNKTSKTSVERILKVQKKRSQSSSKKNLSESKESPSPLKTRSAKKETASRQTLAGKQRARTGNRISKSTPEGKKLSPSIKKSTRRK